MREIAPQFETPEQQHDTVIQGMWVFLATEILFFGSFITAFVVYQVTYNQGFIQGSRELNIVLATMNTFVLLTSSLTMALGVYFTKTGSRRRAVLTLLGTAILGCIFIGIKAFEYYEDYRKHLIPSHSPESELSSTQIFYWFYYAMTSLHALHLSIGIILVLWMTLRTLRNCFSSEYYHPIEVTGLYWHFVDLVWVFLFPILYLQGRSG